jgi:uncharacterized protein YgiM (DUF1202 family)
MPSSIRLLAIPEHDQRTVRFYAAFPAPAPDAPPDCRPAGLFTGDPKTGLERAKIAELTLCAPTAVTWHEDHRVELGSYTYASPGRQAAHLRWGEAIVVADIDLESEAVALTEAQPTLALFVVKPAADQGLMAAIRLEVLGLQADQQLRIDAGAGQVYRLAGSAGPDQQAEWSVSYHKSGEYTMAVDLLDGEGFWLATLAQNPLEIAPPAEPALPDLEGEPEAPAEPAPPLLDVGALPTSNPPWLPFNYVRPVWGGVRTYTTPGGSRVSRSLVLGTYLAIQSETVAGGQVWYQSTHGDWVAASAVAHVTPSSLRGVELQAATPPPPPPPPGGVRYGVVTAALLNVRARPGVSPDNPPISQLPSGAQVTIYEERLVDGATWYRIGDNRWVHGAYVRLIQEPPPPSLRRGVVTADVLNVRSQPGVGYPVVDQLRLGAEVTIYEEQPVAGVPWYRVGVGRWVHSGWVRILPAELAAQVAVASGPTLPVGWVVSASLNVRARPGVSPDNPPIDEVLHNQRLDILETRTVDGARWYRIGADRWVLGTWVAAALSKPRPAGIRANERWVGVNLGQQTAVAYEGDTPVYAAMVATGLPTTPTVQGVFRTWQRLATGKMSGGSAATGGYYYLEGVTWTCYFYAGYALHTAYWHDAFGRTRSHGCVNLSPYDAWWIFQWSAPGGASSPAVYVYAG